MPVLSSQNNQDSDVMKGRQDQTVAGQGLAYRFNGGRPMGPGPSARQKPMAPNKPNCRGFRPENRVGRKNKPNVRAWPARRRGRGLDGAKQSQFCRRVDGGHAPARRGSTGTERDKQSQFLSSWPENQGGHARQTQFSGAKSPGRLVASPVLGDAARHAGRRSRQAP